MDKRTVLRAYKAADALSNQPTESLRAALQAVRLKKDLAEGEEISDAQRQVIEAYSEDGRTVPDEKVDAFQEEMIDVLEESADTDPDEVRSLDLKLYETDGLRIAGEWIIALIEVGAVDEGQAMDLLDQMEDED